MLKKVLFGSSRHYSTIKDPTKACLKERLTLPYSTSSAKSKTENLTSHSYTPFDTQMSKLDNGLRVASEEYIGEFCTVGVAIESGSRFEALFPKGITNVVEKLAFASTLKHDSREQITSVLEKSGALIDCQSTRDTIIYATSCHRDRLAEMMEIISNAIFRPVIRNEEIMDAFQASHFESEELGKQIEIEPFLNDRIHQAAFRSNTLGFSKCGSLELMDPSEITREKIFGYLSRYYTPKRIVLAGVGVPHKELHSLAETFFDERTSTWILDKSVIHEKTPEIDHSTAQYTGGEVRKKCDLSEVGAGTPYPHLAHVALGFEGTSYKSEDFVPFCVLQSLLGGGGSFSAGGPGKGMFTRLYVDVLNRCHWLYRCTAFNYSYADAGLFCIQASCPPDSLNDALIVIADQFLKLGEGVDADELARAKIQLKSQIMMNLEVRPVIFEDLARQVIAHGRRRKPEETMGLIDKVTGEDIVRVAKKMLQSKPSLVGFGEVDGLSRNAAGLAKFEQLEEAIAQRDLRVLLPKKTFSWQ